MINRKFILANRKRKNVLTISMLATLALSGCAHVAGSGATAENASVEVEIAPSPVDMIAADPIVKAAFTTIEGMNEGNIDRLVTLTEIPAPPFGEDARAAVLADMLKAAGLDDVSTDASGNVIARRLGTIGNRTIAVVAHIDTVFPEGTDVTVRREDNIYYAPGIGDNTRGLVVLLSLVDALEAHNIETAADILFIGSVGEEGLGDLRGVRHLFREGGPKIDSFIAIDGGSDDRVVTDAVGSNRYLVTFSGPGGHSYGAFGRAHPHQALSETIVGFTKAARRITDDGTKATFSVGRIGGGTSINSIPFTSWMEVDMRSAEPAKLAQLDAAFQKAAQKALEKENNKRLDGDPLSVEIKNVGQRPPGRANMDASLLANMRGAMQHLGIEPRFVASSTDANIPISLGIPAITISRGGVSKNAHAPNESWENTDAHLAIQAALLALIAEAEME